MTCLTKVEDRSNARHEPHQTVSSIPEHKGSSDKEPHSDPGISLWRHLHENSQAKKGEQETQKEGEDIILQVPRCFKVFPVELKQKIIPRILGRAKRICIK
jgi:hypothetical protein